MDDQKEMAMLSLIMERKAPLTQWYCRICNFYPVRLRDECANCGYKNVLIKEFPKTGEEHGERQDR